MIEGFVRSTLSAQALGFDGVELHGAHGYLVDQFFWAHTNCRTNEYGGQSLAERVRFGVELVEKVREAVGPDYPIGMRISQWKMGDYKVRLALDPQELESFVRPLSRAGVDLFHCSTRRFYDPEFLGSPLNLAGWVKKITGKPMITVGSIGTDLDFVSTQMRGETPHASLATVDQLTDRLEAEEFDLAAVGRALLADPQWVQKVTSGQVDAIRPFSKDLLEEPLIN